jgi:hypothetical protein
MCHLCKTIDLDDAKTLLAAHGYRFIQPNAPLQYAVTWDDRPVTITDHRERAVTFAKEQSESNVGRWEAKQRLVGPWEPLTPERAKVGTEFWAEQRKDQ